MKMFLKYKKIFAAIFFCFFVLTSSFAQTSDSVSSYQSIHYRGVATINMEGQQVSGQFNYMNEIDSFFFVQLNVGGFEAGRILATPNDVVYINKLQRNYYKGGYAFFRQFIDVEIDFYTLQAIFNGVSIDLPEGVILSYEGKTAENVFFSTLLCEHEEHPLQLKLEIKKVNFENIPKVSAVVPKNYTEIMFCGE
jgi:hypothetical protein